MGTMQVTMIDENKYAETMTDVVLPALEQCREEGWFDPSAAERSAGIEPLSGIMDTGGRSGQLHYLCYDSAKFDAIREQGATAIFRGAIVISHGFTEFAEKYDELVWYFLLAGYSVCVLEHRGHGKSARDVDNRCMVWIDDWQRYVADLAGFAETIGQQYAAGMPLNHVLAHGSGSVMHLDRGFRIGVHAGADLVHDVRLDAVTAKHGGGVFERRSSQPTCLAGG